MVLFSVISNRVRAMDGAGWVAAALLLVLAIAAQLWLPLPWLAPALCGAALSLMLLLVAQRASPAESGELPEAGNGGLSSYRSMLKELQQLATEEPVRVAAVIDCWLHLGHEEASSGDSGPSLAVADQAAALLVALEKPVAARILRELSPAVIQRVAVAMAELEPPSAQELLAVLRRLFGDVARFSAIQASPAEEVGGLLEEALGPEKARLLTDQLAVRGQSQQLSKLKWLDASLIAAMLQREHPQIQAALIACLESGQAGEVLLAFPPERRVDLLSRISALETLSSSALRELDWLIEDYLNKAGNAMGRALAGEAIAASVLNELDVGTEAELLSGLRRLRPSSAERVEDLMFGFDQLERLSDADLETLLNQLNPAMVKVALHGAPKSLVRRVTALRAELAERGDGVVKPAEVRAARNEIVLVAKRMAAVGELILDARKLDIF